MAKKAKKKSLADKIEANRKRALGTAAGNALRLRIDLAMIVFQVLKIGEATPLELSIESKIGLPRIKAILNADDNCTTADIGSLGFALGVPLHFGVR